MNIDAVIEGYLALRGQKEALAKQQKEAMEPLTTKMEKIENWLQAQLQSQGMTSVAAKGIGTAYLETRTDASVADWDAAFAWIRQTEQWAFLERRVAKSVVKDYMEAHGDVPPGIAVNSEVVLRVRKG